MKGCPNCQKPHGVNAVLVLCAAPSFPARCKTCGKGFHPAAWRATAESEIVFFHFGLAATAASSGAKASLVFAVGFAAVAVAIRAFVPLVALQRNHG